jgi:hypothetical protein
LTSALKTWRQSRRASEYWEKARARSQTLPPGQVLEYLETTVMLSGQALSRYRNAALPEAKQDQLLELRMNLEAALGMLDNLLRGR